MLLIKDVAADIAKADDVHDIGAGESPECFPRCKSVSHNRQIPIGLSLQGDSPVDIIIIAHHTKLYLISSSYRHTLSRHERILYHHHSMIICTPFHERIPLSSIPCDECIPLPCNYVLQVMHMNKLGKQQLSKYIDRSLTQGLELLERATRPAR